MRVTHKEEIGVIASRARARGILVCLLLSSAVCLAAAAADVSLGPCVHLWPSYPSELLDLNGEAHVLVGPMLSFSAGLLSCDFWYSVDPSRTGALCLSTFGSETPAAVVAELRDVGWRISNTGPLFLSASISLLSWEAWPLCAGAGTPRLDTTTVAGGAGLRLGPAWVLAEYGIAWTKATPEFSDVPASPISNLVVAAGLSLQLNAISADRTRYPVEHYALTLEEGFNLGCGNFCWEGQAGKVTWIEEQLGLLLSAPEQTLIRPLGVLEDRYVLDFSLIPRSSPSAQHSSGVALRYLDDQNYALVEFRTDGRVRYTTTEEGEISYDSGWHAADSLRTGAANDVRVVAPGNRIIVYVNGQRVLDEEEVTYVSGDIGLAARTYGSAGTWASFDDVAIRALEVGTVLDPRSSRARNFELADRGILALVAGAGLFVSYRESILPLACGFAGALLADLLAPSTHLVRVK